MKKDLFVAIVKQAHYLTKEYLKRFSQYDYKAQYSIFFRLVHEVYKQKEEIKQADNVPVESVPVESVQADNVEKVVKESFFKRVIKKTRHLIKQINILKG